MSQISTPDVFSLSSSLQKEGETSVPLIILLGPPGAGKGTLAGPLAEHLNIPHISTGDLFRYNIRNGTSIGIEAKQYINQGRLAPDPIVMRMVFERMQHQDCQKGAILDGFPRNLFQAKTFQNNLPSFYRVCVLNFVIQPSALLERIVNRITCKNCGKPYHLKHAPPQSKNQCDSCQGLLEQRPDDCEEILVQRLQVYEEETAPLIDFYHSQEGVLKNIEANQSPTDVLQSILYSLKDT